MARAAYYIVGHGSPRRICVGSRKYYFQTRGEILKVFENLKSWRRRKSG